MLAAACTAGAGWLADRLRPARRSESTPAVGSGGTPPVIPPETLSTLLVIADVIVPRHGDSPSASEIDLIARLERLISDSPARAATYRTQWVKLAKTIQEKVPVVDGKPDPDELARHLRIYHGRFRRTRRGGDLGNAFEQLRRDVMRIYYTSPEGRAWVGHDGRHVGDPWGES